jgi:hypothetical protein
LGALFGYIGYRLERVAGAGVSFRRPLWLTGLVLSVLGPAEALIGGDAQRQALAAAACALIYAATLAAIRRPVWIYPLGLWCVASFELGLSAAFPSTVAPADLLGALALPACLALVLAEVAAQRTTTVPTSRVFALAGLMRSRWAVPPLVVAVVCFGASLVAGSMDPAVGRMVAATYAVALAAVAMRHGQLQGERWTSLVLLAVAVVDPFDAGRSRPELMPLVVLGSGVILAWLSVAVDLSTRLRLRAWRGSLMSMALVLAALGELEAWSQILAGSLHIASAATVLCGVLLLTLAYARRGRLWAYGGTAALVVAALIEIAAARISQPQAYALPVGVYAAALAWMEWRRGDRSHLKRWFEISALLVLLGTTLLQGVGYIGDGLQRYPYDVALIPEGMAVLGLGAVCHWWRSLFAGAAGVVIAVLILLAEPLATVNTWYLVGGLGLLLMGGVVLLERRRQQIPAWFEGWRERLEAWT